MNRKHAILLSSALIALPVSAFAMLVPVAASAYIDCRESTGCSIEQLIQIGGHTFLSAEDRASALREAISRIQAQIASLSVQSSPPTVSASLCLDLKSALIIGSTDATTNGEVSKLQNFLIRSENNPSESDAVLQTATGYYGVKTANAVFRWQKAHGMDFVTIKSGVGPMTRAKMKCGSTKAPVITRVEWRIEPANSGATDSYKKDEQAIFVDVIRSDNSIRGYSVGKAYGCAASGNLPTMSGKKVLGFVNCYYALSGVAFTAYEANGKFIVERGDESAKDGSVKKTVVLEI